MSDPTYKAPDPIASLESRLARQAALLDALERSLVAAAAWGLDAARLADDAMRVGLAECERLRAIELAARRYVESCGVGTAERFAELRASLDGGAP